MKKLDKYGFLEEKPPIWEYSPLDFYSLGKHNVIMNSPWAYANRYILKNKKDPTPAMKFGIILHQVLLEPKKYADKIMVIPKFEGKGSRTAKQEFLLFNKDKILLDEKDYDKLSWMLDSLLANKMANKILSEGKSEVSALARDEHGINHYAQYDYLRDDGLWIDVKTCLDPSRESFEKSLFNLEYYLQAGYYEYVKSLLTGTSQNECLYICIQSVMPYQIGIYHVDPSVTGAGIDKIQEGLEKYKKWEKTFEKAFAIAKRSKDPIKLRKKMLSMFPQINSGKIENAQLPAWAVNKLSNEWS